MLKIIKKLAHKSNYGAKRNASDIKYIVIHYTGNDGDTDGANANYFIGANRHASAHYFVDDDSVTQSVPDNYVAWSVGGGLMDGGSKYYSKGGKFYGKCTNSNSISIEMCDTVKNGKNDLSIKTRSNVIDLTRRLAKKYNIPKSNVIRHFDVNHKLCPVYFVTNEQSWINFRDEIFKDTTVVKNEASVQASKSKTLKMKVTAKSGLLCRAKASTDKSVKIIGSFMYNTIVTVVNKTNKNWYKVKGKGSNGTTITGYCSTKYLK